MNDTPTQRWPIHPPQLRPQYNPNLIALRFSNLDWPGVSQAISAYSNSWVNHVDIAVSDKTMVSVFPPVVQELNYDSLPTARSEWRYLKCTPNQRLKAEAFAKAQVGKLYNLPGLALFPLQLGIEWPGGWFCSELVAAALVHAGIVRLDKRSANVSPHDLYRLTSR